jgi:hypothetical protein
MRSSGLRRSPCLGRPSALKHTGRRRLGLAALPLAAWLAAGSAAAEELRAVRDPDPVRGIYDLVVLRPLDLTALAVSAGVFAVAYPVAQITGGSGFVREVCTDLSVERVPRRPHGALWTPRRACQPSPRQLR